MSPGVKRTGVAAAVLAVGIWLAAAPARAHPEPPSTLINRYVTLWVAGARLDVQFSLLHGPVTAVEARRQIDHDADGRLSESELAQYSRDFAAGAGDLIQLDVDGRPLPLRWTPRIDLNGNPAVTAVPLVRELGGWAPLPPGEHRLEVRLGPGFPRLGDTEVALDAGEGWSLISSVPPAGTSGLGRQDRFQIPHGHGDGDAPARVAFVIRSGAGGAPVGRRLVLPLAAAIAAAAIAVAVWFVRRSRQRP